MISFALRKKFMVLALWGILGIFAAGWILLSASAPSGDDSRRLWRGTIRVRTWAEGAPCLTGVFDTSWTVNILWEETGRTDVRDRKETSSASSSASRTPAPHGPGRNPGTFIHNGPGWVREDIYSGAGSGTGNVFYDAVVYFRLSDDDPLKDVLPHGAYTINTAVPAIAAFDTAIRSIQTDRNGRVSEYTTNFQKIAMLHYCIGELALGLNSRRWTGSVVAEDIKPYVQGVDMDGHDTEMRSLASGRMQGNYDNKSSHGMNLGRNRFLHNAVSWDISRQLNVQASLEKATRKWRPKGGPQKNTIQITARIEPGGNYKGKFRFTLFDVSKEKGWAMNAGDEKTYDLRFASGQVGFGEPVSPDFLIIEGTETVEEARVAVEALDYGRGEG